MKPCDRNTQPCGCINALAPTDLRPALTVRATLCDSTRRCSPVRRVGLGTLRAACTRRRGTSRAPSHRHPAVSLDRRLAADYAFDYDASGGVLRRQSRRIPRRGATRSRATQRHPRQRDADRRHPAGAAAPPRRAARGARRRRAAARPADGRHRHRPAGGTLRRPALHAAQGDDGDPAGRARARRAPRAGGRRSSGSTPRITTGTKSRRAASSTPSCACQVVALGDSARRASRPGGARASGRLDRRRARRARGRAPADRVHAAAARRRSGSAYRPGAGMADAFGRWLETVLGPRGLVVYDASDPAAKPLVAELFAREIEHAGRHLAPGGARRAPRSQARGYHAQVTPHDGQPSRSFTSNGGREPIRRDGATAFVVGDARESTGDLLDARARSSRTSSAPTCCCGRSCRTRSFPPSATWPAPTSWPTSASSRRLRGVRHPDAADAAARHAPRSLDANAMRFLDAARVPARVAAGAGRSGAERSCSKRSCRRRVEASLEDARARDRGADDALARRGRRRSTRRSKAPRARRWRGCRTT